jgi:hypothetical protein
VKGAFYIKDILDEFSDNVELEGEDVYALIHKKYLGDVNRRIRAHGWKVEVRRKRSFMILIKASAVLL